MNKSILFLTNTYPDFDASYRGVFIKKMAVFLREDGHEISVVTPKIYGKSRYFEQQQGIKVYRFPFLAGDKLLIEHKRVPYLKMVLYYLTGTLLTLFVMLRNGCKLIHVHWAIPAGLIGVWAGMFLRKPLIVTIHGSDFRMAFNASVWINKIFLYVCKRADSLTVVSELMREELERNGVRREKITVFPMGIEDRFLEMGTKREKSADRSSLTVLSNRNLLPIYNLSLLIRAIPNVLDEEPEARFLIAGEGPERKDLEREVRRLKLDSSVAFLGRIPHPEMPALLSASDIYVSTSLYDGTSVSLLEAMACGVFPVVTDIPSNREWIIDGENGFLVPTGDKNLLARRIVEAYRKRAFFCEGLKKNREIAQRKAHWGSSMKKLKGIYEGVSRNPSFFCPKCSRGEHGPKDKTPSGS